MMASDLIRLCAILFVALALVPVGAHLAELPNKIGLPPEQYMLAQRLYSGWALFGIAILAALLFTAAHTVLVRNNAGAFIFSLMAFVCLAATQVIFWLFTYPMNVASANWTQTPEPFEAARRQWEYSHAAAAVLTFIALIAIVLSLLREGRHPKARPLR